MRSSMRRPDSLDLLVRARKTRRSSIAGDGRFAERKSIVLGDAPELAALTDGYAVLDRGHHVLAHFEAGLFDVFKASDFSKDNDDARYIVRCADRVVTHRKGPTRSGVEADADGLSLAHDCDIASRDRKPAASMRCAGGQA